jgi:branched-chain amino acid transport system permease protein
MGKRVKQVLAVTSKVSVPGRLQFAGLSPLKLVFLAILAIGPLFIEDEYLIRLLVVSLLLGGQAIIFDFTAGFINIVNFGLAGLVGLGAYTSALLVIKLGASPWIGLIAATVSTGTVGFLIGILVLRLRGIYAAIMTWLVAMTLQAIATAAVPLTNGYLGLSVPLLLETSSTRPYYYVLLLLVVLTYVIEQAVVRSHIGLAFKAIGQNVDAAEASGVNLTKYKVFNFTLASVLLGLFGGYYAHFMGVLTPDVMATSHATEVLALSYIGGRGTIWGGLVAAFLIIPVFEYLRELLAVRLVIYGLLMIVVMLFWPGGIARILQGIKTLVGRQIGKVRGAADRQETLSES